MREAVSLIVRTPSYSLNFFNTINQEIQKDPENFNKIIGGLVNDTFFMSGIFYASPSLYELFLKEAERNTAGYSKLTLSIYKYLSRVCSRSIPFGLFAGLNVANIHQGDTSFDILEKERHIPFVRFDMNYLMQLMQVVCNDSRVKTQVKYFINNTIYRLNDHKYRYIEHQLVNGRREYSISEFGHSYFLNIIIRKFKKTGITLDEFLKITASEGIDEDESRDFFFSLIDNQIFKSELDVNITGEFYFDRIVQIINKLNGVEDIKFKLNSLSNIFSALNKGQISPIDADESINVILPEIEFTRKFQADLRISFKNSNINQKVIHHLTEDLGRIIECFAQPFKNPRLDNFKKLFLERYGDAEIPLAIALDPDLGLTYSDTKVGSTPLIENIVRKGAAADQGTTVDHLKQLLINKCLLDNKTNINLSDADLDNFKKQYNNGLQSFNNLYYVLGSFICRSASDLDLLNYQFELKALVNNSAANLMSRFAYLDDRIHQLVGETISQEHSSGTDWIDAEVVHLNSAEGNVLIRPQLREYEIPFASLSCLADEKQLPINDLYLSVKQNRFVLRSKRLNKYVRARLSTAHIFNKGLPLYKFLGDLQTQDSITKLNWSWEHLSDLAFCPRVNYKNIVLAKARWIIDDSFIGEVSLDALNKHLQFLTQEKGLPSWVTMSDGDNELLLDLRLSVSREILFDHISSNKRVVISEYLNPELSSFIKGGQGDNFVHEILLSFSADIPVTPMPSLSLPVIRQKNKQLPAKKMFLPFDGCLSLKIYCGEKIAERILTQTLKNIILDFEKSDASNYWFFLRYHDPEPHIRIRFFSDNKQLLFDILTGVNKKLAPDLKAYLVFSVQIDTYKREWERYGNDNIVLFESHFFKNSSICLQLISYITGTVKDENYRIFAVVKMIDHYLSKYFQSLKEKYLFCQRQKQLFVNEFNNSLDHKQSLKTKYREYRSDIDTVLNSGNIGEDDIYLQKIFRFLALHDQSSDLGFIKTESQLASVVHMAINRFFITEQRLHELFVYDMLENAYRSNIAKTKQLTYAG